VPVHNLHIVVLVLGVLFSLRLMDVAQRSEEHCPAVDPSEFRRWKGLARGAYRLGQTACFGKILLDYIVAYSFGVPKTVALGWTLRTIGFSLDVGWVALMVVSYLRIRKAHKLAAELGIERRTPAKQD
jgi:hypothetical protein